MKPLASNLSTANPSLASQTAPLVAKEAMHGEPRREYQLAVSGLVLVAVLIGGGWMFWITQDGLNPMPSISIENKEAPAPAIEPVTQPAVSAIQAESIHTDVYFDNARSRIRDDAKTILQAQATRLKEGSWAVLVQGYTDPHGPVTYNKALGLRRAEAVKNYLVELGVPASMITAVSLGKEAVTCTGETADCLQRNRRVHLELVPTPPAVASAMPEVEKPLNTAPEPTAQASDQTSGAGVIPTPTP
jgi:peptidoglycan-associated lipoprotein